MRLLGRVVRILLLGALAGFALDAGLRRATRLEPPTPAMAARPSSPSSNDLVRAGSLPVLTLRGDPATIGRRHAELTQSSMRAIDVGLEASFESHVPNPISRFLLDRLVRLRAPSLRDAIPPARLEEIAAEAATFAPHDEALSHMATFDRLVVYHAMYDLALAYERSPLAGCSIFGVSGTSSADGHLLIGRNFDLEEEILDREKLVLRMAPDGKIPFLSVAWAGMTGAVTGLNAEGVFVAVNGARAGEATRHGVPLPFVLRAVLEDAHTIEDALRIAQAMPVMVPHILFLGDGKSGRMAVLERSPAESATRTSGPGTFYVTNHFLTPRLAVDPRNLEVRERTTTLARYERLGELLPPQAPPLDVARAIKVLRDGRGAKGIQLGNGDRRAIDAAIATHSVVADATARVLYVAEGPHTGGRYIAVPVVP